MRHYDMYDYYDYGSSYFDSIMWGIVMIITIALIVWAIFSLGSYILRGIGMYTMAKRMGIDYAWLAFVPFARTYLHGTLSGTILLKKKSIQNPGVWLLALPFIYGAIYSILYAILWFIGFGTLMKIDSYSYYSAGISTGSIMGILVIFIILMIVVLGYTAVYKALQVLVNHQILERFTSKNMSIVHGLLCTFIPLYESICFFAMRNRPFNPGMEPPTPTPFMQSPPPGAYYGPSGQTGYTDASMQGGYGNYNGNSSPSDPNGYGNYNGYSTPSDSTGYGNYNSGNSAPTSTNNSSNFGGTPTPTDTNNYSNFGGASTSTDTNSYNHFDGQPVDSTKTTIPDEQQDESTKNSSEESTKEDSSNLSQ